jgi:hypothetical protein
MNEIRTLLRFAQRRLEASRFLSVLHVIAIVVAAVAAALAVADRVHVSFVTWFWVGPTLAAGMLLAALVVWLQRRPTELHVAVTVDDRLDLRERLSTALHCQRRDDAFARAAMEDAVKTASDPRTREFAKRRFKVAAPGRWWISPMIAIVAAGILFLPEARLFATEDPIDTSELDTVRAEAVQSVEAVVRAIEDKPELAAELADLLGELSEQGIDPEAMKSAEEVKRQAIKKVTELGKKLDDLLTGEKGQTAKTLENMMSQLKRTEEGPAKDLADAMANGDFSQAKSALEDLVEQAEAGELDAEQLKQAAEQLASLAAQLEQLAQQKQDLQEALQQAGIDPQLANNPQALQQQLQQNQNLNEQQKQQLQQMAKAQQQAQQMCQGLGQACQQLAQAMQNGQMGQMGQAGQQMGNQLNQMEQLQQLMQQAQAAMNQCAGQCQGLGQGMNMNQALQQWKQGQGMGQWGQGSGGRAPLAPTPTGFKMQKANIKTVEGEIIARTLFEGEVTVGRSTKSRSEVIAEVVEGFAEAQPDETIPRIYKEAQQHYFGELERQAEVVERADESTEAAAEDEPASED